MIQNSNGVLNSRKKKGLAFILSGIAILALGSGVAYAASSTDTNVPENLLADAETSTAEGSISVTNEGIEISSVNEDGTSIKASVQQNEDGSFRYSTDDGKTWSDEVPDGLEDFSFSINEEGTEVSSYTGN